MASRTGAIVASFGLAAAIALSPSAGQAAITDTYYQHSLMLAANGRCRLFDPALTSALNAAQALARTAALRAGASDPDIAAAGQRARARAQATPCNSADLALAASRERTGFEAYSRLQSTSYKGDVATWWVNRQASKTGRVWNLYQANAFGRDSLTFGLAGLNGVSELTAVVQFADGAHPYAARLVMRDKTKSQLPYLDRRGADGRGVIALAGRIPPASADLTFLADASGEPDLLLRPSGKAPAIAYRFPAAAAQALAALDPRESVAVQFQISTPTGDQTRTGYIEVGDYAAGVAFLNVP